jgi:hypothetical protein
MSTSYRIVVLAHDARSWMNIAVLEGSKFNHIQSLCPQLKKKQAIFAGL